MAIQTDIAETISENNSLSTAYDGFKETIEFRPFDHQGDGL
jgi:hypothetical protein